MSNPAALPSKWADSDYARSLGTTPAKTAPPPLTGLARAAAAFAADDRKTPAPTKPAPTATPMSAGLSKAAAAFAAPVAKAPAPAPAPTAARTTPPPLPATTAKSSTSSATSKSPWPADLISEVAALESGKSGSAKTIIKPGAASAYCLTRVRRRAMFGNSANAKGCHVWPAMCADLAAKAAESELDRLGIGWTSAALTEFDARVAKVATDATDRRTPTDVATGVIRGIAAEHGYAS